MRTFHAPIRSRQSPCYRLGARKLVISNLFTGIVQGTAAVERVDRKDAFSSIQVALPGDSAANIKIGASVAINGTCLTVTEIAGSKLCFDIIQETLRATNLGGLAAGASVNFERSATVGDEIGGHTVSGHVHTTATISSIKKTEDNTCMRFTLKDTQWMKYILPKGFVAVDGCSLTVCEVDADGFNVYLIPETLRATVLGTKVQGDTVNIEIEAQTQAIVDTVERVVKRYMENLPK